jgi:dTDP-4-amino-4,6-dideoxygalactose transaminase
LGSTYRGRPLGTLGDGSFFTFLFSKPLSAGGGGCAMTKDRRVAEHVQNLLRERADESFVSGLAHVLLSLSFALAYRQPFYSLMTRLTHVGPYRRTARTFVNHVSPLLHMRRSDWGVVVSRLRTWDADRERNAEFWEEVRACLPPGWYIPPEPRVGKWNHWLLPVCPPTADAAAAGIAKLRNRGVGVGLIYDDCLDNARPYGYSGDCAVAERLSRCVFLLPAHSALTFRERRHILKCLEQLNQLNDLAVAGTGGVNVGCDAVTS